MGTMVLTSNYRPLYNFAKCSTNGSIQRNKQANPTVAWAMIQGPHATLCRLVCLLSFTQTSPWTSLVFTTSIGLKTVWPVKFPEDMFKQDA